MPIPAGRTFNLWPWAAGAAALATVAMALSPELVRNRIPEAGKHYAAFVLAGITVARICLLAVASLCVATGVALKRWGSKVECVPATSVRPAFPIPDWAVALALFVCALVLRLPTIGASLWMDEMNTVARIVDKGLPVVLAFSSEGNNHQLNTILMWLCSRLFGETEWALRLPVLLLGALTPAAAFLALRRLIPAGAALTAGALMVLHFRYVEFSANARGYAGVILFSTLACCLFARLWCGFRWQTAAGYVLAGAGTAAFVPTTLYVPAAHGAAALVALIWTARRRAPGSEIARAGAVLGACVWACLLGLSFNSLTLPQLLDYARHGAERAHAVMGLDLLSGIAFMMSGSFHLPVACLVLLVSAWGMLRYRANPWFQIAVLAPIVLYMSAITALGMRTSPRMFVQFIFPSIAGLALFLYSEWQKTPRVPHRIAAALLVAVCLIDPAPQFQNFYGISNPPLKQLARRLEGQSIMLVGDQSDLNAYYFRGATAVFPKDMGGVEERIRAGHPKYIVGGMDCAEMARREGWIEVGRRLGYRPVERLMDWTIGEQAGAGERQPCFLVLSVD